MINLMLDSGAFTAWKKQSQIDIDAYIKFIKDNIDSIENYVNLDCIPGEFGRVPSPAEVEVSAQISWDNMLYMEEFSLKPIPVFHMGEQFRWLQKMVDHGCPYVGISPANDRSTKEKRMWLDRVFSMIVDKDGWPIVKTHAFGMTSVPLLYRYPWYSADSVTWVFVAAHGGIMVPRHHKGELSFAHVPNIIHISTRNVDTNRPEKKYQLLTQDEKRHIDKWIDYCGTNIEQCGERTEARMQVNATFFRELAARRPDLPFKPKSTSLFGDL